MNIFNLYLRCFIRLSIVSNIYFVNAQDWMSLNPSYLNIWSTSSIFIDSSNNKMYAGGFFSHSNNSEFNCIAVWDGNSWDSLASGIYGSPLQIGKYKGDLVACGGFWIQPNGIDGRNFLKWTGNSWVTIGGGTNGAVQGFYEINNNLIVYGLFDSVGTIAASKIAIWDGQNWYPFDTTIWDGYAIFDLEVYNGDIYIAGNFYNHDQSIGKLARWDGLQWHAVDNNVMFNGLFINRLYVFNNELYIGGYFTKSDGCPGDYLVKWDGQNLSEVGVGNINGQVMSFFEYNNELYIGGKFMTLNNGDTAANLLRWDGNSMCKFESQIIGGIWCIELYYGNLVIGGGFYQIDSNSSISALAIFNGIPQPDTCFSIINNVNKEVANEFKIYPNPASDKLNITFNQLDYENAVVSIVNLLGERIYSSHINDKYFTIDVSGFSDGIYLITIRSENRFLSFRKIIVQH
ncbi:T9SS type A sorting domain-containing protein [candidate division KSB1 bacterium]